jgi:hypothetical protein
VVYFEYFIAAKLTRMTHDISVRGEWEIKMAVLKIKAIHP